MARVLVVEEVVRLLPDQCQAGAAQRRVGAEVMAGDVSTPRGRGLTLVPLAQDEPGPAELPVVLPDGRPLPADVAAGGTPGGSCVGGPASLESLERAIDAAIEADPPALMAAVRDRLARLGVGDGEGERALIGLLLDLFVQKAPTSLAAVEAALDTGDGTALEAGLARLGSAAAHLGAAPLARLCADLEERARCGSVPAAPRVRAALRRELTVTCRVVGALAAELTAADTGERPPDTPFSADVVSGAAPPGAEALAR